MQSLGSLLHHTREKWFLEAPELQVLWNDAKQDYNDTFVSPTAKKSTELTLPELQLPYCYWTYIYSSNIVQTLTSLAEMQRNTITTDSVVIFARSHLCIS